MLVKSLSNEKVGNRTYPTVAMVTMLHQIPFRMPGPSEYGNIWQLALLSYQRKNNKIVWVCVVAIRHHLHYVTADKVLLDVHFFESAYVIFKCNV